MSDTSVRHNIKFFGRGTTPMLFAHGFGCDQNMWRFVTPAFEDAYRLVQSHAMRAWKDDLVFREEVGKDPAITGLLSADKLQRTFDYTRQLGNVDAIFKRVLGE